MLGPPTINSAIVSDADKALVTALLRIMMLRGDPPAALVPRLLPEHASVVQEGTRLRGFFCTSCWAEPALISIAR
jgi:hypothetical protein